MNRTPLDNAPANAIDLLRQVRSAPGYLRLPLDPEPEVGNAVLWLCKAGWVCYGAFGEDFPDHVKVWLPEAGEVTW